VRRRAALLVVSGVVGGMLLAVSVSGVAISEPVTGTIGPHQHFVGLVNGRSTKAIIEMVCPYPLSSTEMGHPLNGQTIAVEPPSTVAGVSGYTGTRGRSVVASFGGSVVPVTNTSTVTFDAYGSQTLPTTLLLPCSGSGSVVFSPQPTSKTAKSVTVTVTYGNITVNPSTSISAKLTPSRTVTVTQADSGHNYRLHKGDLLDVQLSGPSIYTWTEPASANQAVLQRTGGSPGAMATATFTAVARGKVEVTAIDNPDCYPQCLPPSRLFEVMVTVVG